jgi:hypothetical protein
MDEQQSLNRDLQRVERDRHFAHKHIQELNSFLGEGIAKIVHSCMGQLLTFEHAYQRLCDREEALRHQLAAVSGPDYKAAPGKFEAERFASTAQE